MLENIVNNIVLVAWQCVEDSKPAVASNDTPVLAGASEGSTAVTSSSTQLESLYDCFSNLTLSDINSTRNESFSGKFS